MAFPGGFGTLDELMEILTLAQTRKLDRRIPVLLYGARYWNEIVDFGALVRHGMIAREDTELFDFVDLGSHGRKGLTRLLLGSVAERVLREAPCTVVVIRRREATSELRARVGVRPLSPPECALTTGRGRRNAAAR